MARIVTHEYAYDLYYPPFDRMPDNELLNFCALNRDLLIERDEEHQLMIFPPRSSNISMLNAHLSFEIGMWNRKNNSGFAFDSSAGFFLPDTSMRSPDAAWISNERWDALSEEKEKKNALSDCV
ncbi:hypothetical protein BH10BAC3_BH10BAC3_21260 [soil metagenome]